MRPKKTSDLEILTIARRCVMQFGIGVSTQIIAKEIGVSQATLFKRFGTKEALLQRALLHPILSHSIFRLLEEAPKGISVMEQLHALSFALLRFFEEMLPNMMMLRSGGCDLFQLFQGSDTPPHIMRQKLTVWIQELQSRSKIRNIDAETFALALLGSIQHRAFRRHLFNDHSMNNSDEDYISQMVDLFWFGISKGETT